jgi:hypothetical protein
MTIGLKERRFLFGMPKTIQFKNAEQILRIGAARRNAPNHR